MARRCSRASYCSCGAEKDADNRCVVTPAGPGLKAHRAFLSPRMLEAVWLRKANPYTRPLWRDWTEPTPFVAETGADVLRRQLATKPAGYSWTLWHHHPRPRVPARSRSARPTPLVHVPASLPPLAATA